METETTKKNIFGKAAPVILFLGVFLLGVYVGHAQRSEASKAGAIANKENTAVAADFEPFWKAWNIINERSPFANSVSDQDKIWGAISGLAASLNDPYTTFFPPSENKDFADELNAEFEGVGMELGLKDNMLRVIAPLKDTPAYRAGIKSGDIILKIDDTVTTDMSLDKALELVRGKAGTKVTLTIVHDGEDAPKEIEIIREKIAIPVIDTKLRDDGVFVITLYSFSSNSARAFEEAMYTFKQSKSHKLILDLRGNPGGFLDAAIDMASWFLPEGKPVVIEDFGIESKRQIYRSKGYGTFGSDLQMAILVDGGSASASEILAGALKEHGIAKLIGQKTYGKGSVQELVSVTPEAALKITIAKWLTPNGISISEKGLDPDIAVKITKEDVLAGTDPQMERALAEVNK